MVHFKQAVTVVMAWYMSIWTQMFFHPSESYAIAVATRIKEQPEQQERIIKWDKQLSKVYAQSLMNVLYPQWDKSEFKALKKLWGKESAWNPQARNPNSSAFGIPQLLNLPINTPAPLQIERGLEYIEHRYGKPSVAWHHWRMNGWY